MGGGTSSSCSLTATRPNQEMSNAEIAIKAAKDLNADSLVPELFRAAQDNMFKAKRDYRLKNFSDSRDHALRATRLAEQAEFEAYRMGGATPEVGGKVGSPEGGTPDADSAFKDVPAGTPPATPTPPTKPGGPTGPATPEKQKPTVTSELPGGASSGLPPGGGGTTDLGSTPNLNPYKGVTNYDMRLYEKPDKVGGPIKDMSAKPIGDLYESSGSKGAMQELGTNGNKVKSGYDDMEAKPIDDLKGQKIDTLGDPPSDDDDEKKSKPSEEKKKNEAP
ncbi:MAG: DUF4398 domain-containing protein [Deltaproteobacteria bacterium]|nr:DUF4398 domain-containing protein [Deltaproteobacteria bacterium]